MALDLPHEVRDPIHGLIRLTDQEMAVVNTPTFQRLRRIRQLAMADLVYPGALHTRFEHCLGSLHVAHRILKRLARDEPISDEDFRTVRLAALLHDVGHGPFSHVSEHLLDEYYDKDKVGQAATREKIHEKVTTDIITKSQYIPKLLTPDEQQSIAGILKGGSTQDFRRDIVSSSLDADKMDYLLRDAYFAGVSYGVFDLDKVIDVCRKLERGSETYLVIQEEGLFAVEQLVLAKHHMTQQVYAHRVRTITDLMIVRGLKLAIEDGCDEVRNLYSYDGSPEFLDHYLQFNDVALTTLLSEGSYDRAKSVFQRLQQRKLYKEVALIPLDALSVSDSILLGHLLNIGESAIESLQEGVAAILKCNSWEVIIYKKSIKHPAYHQRGRLEPEAIHVRSRDGNTRMMSDFPGLISAQMPTTEQLHIIGPVEGLGTDLAPLPQEAIQKQQEIESLIFAHIGGT